jgi:hypothetical protein
MASAIRYIGTKENDSLGLETKTDFNTRNLVQQAKLLWHLASLIMHFD